MPEQHADDQLAEHRRLADPDGQVPGDFDRDDDERQLPDYMIDHEFASCCKGFAACGESLQTEIIKKEPAFDRLHHVPFRYSVPGPQRRSQPRLYPKPARHAIGLSGFIPKMSKLPDRTVGRMPYRAGVAPSAGSSSNAPAATARK